VRTLTAAEYRALLARPAALAAGRHRPGKMNRLEEAYASYLEQLRRGGAIAAWKFEPMRLCLAPRCSYTPDFLVVASEAPQVCLDDVKGYWRDDARVKIRVAAAQFPWFRFRGVTRSKGGLWTFEVFRP